MPSDRMQLEEIKQSRIRTLDLNSPQTQHTEMSLTHTHTQCRKRNSAAGRCPDSEHAVWCNNQRSFVPDSESSCLCKGKKTLKLLANMSRSNRKRFDISVPKLQLYQNYRNGFIFSGNLNLSGAILCTMTYELNVILMLIWICNVYLDSAFLVSETRPKVSVLESHLKFDSGEIRFKQIGGTYQWGLIFPPIWIN